jgi:hypothetical protein
MDQLKIMLPHYMNPPKKINPDLLFHFHISVVKYVNVFIP